MKTASISIYPAADLTPGRYLLDAEGRLFPPSYGVVRPVAAVNVLPYRLSALREELERIKGMGDIHSLLKTAPIMAVLNPEVNDTKPAEISDKRAMLKRPQEGSIIPTREKPMRPMARRAKPTPVHVPKDIKDEIDRRAEELREQSRGGGSAVRLPSKKERLNFDPIKLAEAIRRRAPRPPKAKKSPTHHAMSTDPCTKCGIPGRRGCDHQLPYEG